MEDKKSKTFVYNGSYEDCPKNANGWVKITYKNGDTFEGEFREGKPFKGVKTYKSGNTFNGEFVNGKPSKGIKTYKSGNVFDGEFVNGKPSRGNKTYKSGNKFKGEFSKNGRPSKGIKIYTNGNTFDGEFDENGRPSKGKIIYTNGYIYDGEFKNGKPSKGIRTYPNGDIFDGEFDENGRPSKGTKTRPDGVISKGDFNENGELSEGGTIFNSEFDENGKLSKGKIIYTNGYIYDGEFKNGKPSRGKRTYPNGDIFDGDFDENGNPSKGKIIRNDITIFDGEFKNGKCFKGKMIFEDGIFDGYFKNGKRFKGKMIFEDAIFDGYFYENGGPSNGKLTYDNGDIYKGNFKNGKPFRGKMIYINGDVFKGVFKDFELSKGEKRIKDGFVLEGEWENGYSLNVSVKIKPSNTGKSYYLYRRGKNNLQREVKYHLDGHNEVTIDYGRINEILNGKAGGINSLDDLIGNGVVEGVNNFNELKDFTKEMLRDKMSGGIIKGLNKGCSPLESLLLLSSVDTMEQFKKTRFQLHYTKGVEDSLKKDYGSLKNLLESVGIDSIDEVKEDYISLVADTVPLGHAFSVILDIKKMKELVKETGKDLDEAVSSKKVIHCFDSARVLGDSLVTEDETYRDMGALTKNCDFVNLMQQDLGSCWFHAVASTLTAMKHPELVQRIRNGEIELYDIEHILIRDSDKLNEFQFRQMNTIIEISKKFNIELTDDNRAAIDLTIYDKMQEKVEETVPDITRIVLGSALDNKIREQTKNNKSGEAFRRRQEEKLRTNFTREKGESDFAYRVRFEDKVSEEANKHRKALDIRKDDIEKLKAEKNPILYKGKSADDSLFIDMKFTNKIKTIKTIESLDGTCEPRENIFPPFGDRKKLSSFRERERAKNNSKIEREV